MDLVQQIIARAKSNKQRIVLPEATEERTLRAADMVLAEDVADIILIGNPEEINALAAKWGLTHIGKATIIDPENNPKSEEYAALLAELRKKKGMTIEQARELVKDPLYLGCMIIKTNGADGQISGALSTTAETLRPALQIIKCKPGITCVSGAMLLVTKKPEYGENGVLVVGDVAVTPVPDAQQLAQIAVCTAETAKSVAGFADPRVAMLSFSTKGSASHEVVDKVVEATKLAKELAPELKVDGEMQADASDTVFSYIVCCICPVKDGKPELGFFAGENEFHSCTANQIVAPPELGFLFPAFDDRAANLYNALFYSKKPD